MIYNSFTQRFSSFTCKYPLWGIFRKNYQGGIAHLNSEIPKVDLDIKVPIIIIQC